jgi:hypothetical protein
MAELCQRLLFAADTFAGGIAAADDVTLILVRRLPATDARIATAKSSGPQESKQHARDG